MTFLEIIVIAVALAMDAFAVSLAAAAAGFAGNRRATFRLSFHFGLFQAVMPVLGWSLGLSVEPYIARYDHWVAFLLLGLVALRMISAGLRPAAASRMSDPSRGWTLIMLSTATSIDALAIGLTLAALKVSVIYPAAIIGLITCGICILAIAGGRRMGPRLGDRAQIAGGLILLLVGIRVLVFHLT
ncbi:MAG: manganese efflux pump [Acidobacteria bacterium]|uniref:Putative manganese efflux pump MntP n=1 Tax=Candidatus Polarisedimenticola svalbardensis TaxID=2886004 RepID=A0A8J6XTL5_9BACT|nr:manganese efflux pump [Candidatus Polarisedimenticola svalbardensis]